VNNNRDLRNSTATVLPQPSLPSPHPADSAPGRLRLLDYDDLRGLGIKLSRTQIWRLMRAGRFPRQVKIGLKNSWLEKEIFDFIEARIAARDRESAA
jgi:prophage regulatory protein